MDKAIDYILEVARCGGIAKAARNLYITPSALSKYIIQKEDELGVRLFNRTGNKFMLTYPGERYVAMLKELREKRSEMDIEMRRLADMYSGRLRVGFQMSLAEFMTSRIVPAMQDQYPSIRMFLEEAGGQELDKRLRGNHLDIVLALTGEETDGLAYGHVHKSPIVVAAAKDSPLHAAAVKKEGFSHPWLPDDVILREKPILDEAAHSFRRYAGYLLDGRSEFQRSDVTVTNARTALMCVAQDLGIIVLPEFLVQALRFQDEVELYSYGREELWTYLSVIYDPRSVLENEIQEFRRIVLENIEQIGER